MTLCDQVRHDPSGKDITTSTSLAYRALSVARDIEEEFPPTYPSPAAVVNLMRRP